jgi:phosphatidylserine/phosphatidylglycerophosphate/cardiolipin synthase-like enzyme
MILTARRSTTLLVQPDDGVTPLLEAIGRARESLDLYVFRLDYRAIEEALAAAVGRGVRVRTLIAHANGGGTDALRRLEDRLLAIGATVSRTATDLIRYHGKMLVADRRTLYVLGYNFTRRDINLSRSLGVATNDEAVVQEALRLFEADFDRQPFAPELDALVVSPHNSRPVLTDLIAGARRQLLIYDSRLSDNQVQEVLEARARAGVEVRVIGRVEKELEAVASRPYAGKRLHVRAIVQDGRRVFVGSQSLRRMELERRREIGVLLDDRTLARRVTAIFEEDWTAAG